MIGMVIIGILLGLYAIKVLLTLLVRAADFGIENERRRFKSTSQFLLVLIPGFFIFSVIMNIVDDFRSQPWR